MRAWRRWRQRARRNGVTRYWYWRWHRENGVVVIYNYRLKNPRDPIIRYTD